MARAVGARLDTLVAPVLGGLYRRPSEGLDESAVTPRVVNIFAQHPCCDGLRESDTAFVVEREPEQNLEQGRDRPGSDACGGFSPDGPAPGGPGGNSTSPGGLGSGGLSGAVVIVGPIQRP